MKVLYAYARADTVGAGAYVHLRDLTRALIADGHEAAVLLGGEGPCAEELRRLGVPVRTLRYLRRAIHPLRDARAAYELRAILQEVQPDLLALQSSKAGFLGRLAARSVGVAALYTPHGWAFGEGVPRVRRRAYAWLERLSAPLADHIIGVCQHECDLASTLGVARADRLVTIHNGMPDVSTELRADPAAEPVRLITLARLADQKDHDTLLHALAGLRDLPWSLQMLGDGPRWCAVNGLLRRLDLQDRVVMQGAQPQAEVAARLAAAQAYVLISRWEGFPLSILEAMRAGLPVVASDVGGVGEAVADGVSGYLVPRGDVATLRHRLGRLLANPELRARMGREGRARYEDAFTFEAMYARTTALYEQVLAAQNARQNARRPAG